MKYKWINYSKDYSKYYQEIIKYNCFNALYDILNYILNNYY